MIGRPKKYNTEKEAREAKAKLARERYAKKKGSEIRSYDKTTPTEVFRGTKAYRLYYGCKSRSKLKGIPFDLDITYIQELLDNTPECPLLKVPFTEGSYTQSLDKIIPELGYTKGNVWIVSYRANSIKNDASLEELRTIVEGLAKKLNK